MPSSEHPGATYRNTLLPAQYGRGYVEQGRANREAQAKAEAEKEIAMVVKNAEEIDAPAASEFFDNMFVELTPELKKQRQTMRTSSIGQDPSQVDVKQSEGAIK